MTIKLPDNVKWKHGEPSEAELFSLWLAIAASSKSAVYKTQFKRTHSSQIPNCIMLHYGSDDTGCPNWQISMCNRAQASPTTVLVDSNMTKRIWGEWGGENLEDKAFSSGMILILDSFPDFIEAAGRIIAERLAGDTAPIDLTWDKDGVFILHTYAWPYSSVEIYAVPVSAGTPLRDLHFPCAKEDYVAPTVIAVGDKYAFQFNPGHFDTISEFSTIEDARTCWLNNYMNVMHNEVYFIPAEEAARIGLWKKGGTEVNLMGILKRGLQAVDGEIVQMETIM